MLPELAPPAEIIQMARIKKDRAARPFDEQDIFLVGLYL